MLEGIVTGYQVNREWAAILDTAGSSLGNRLILAHQRCMKIRMPTGRCALYVALQPDEGQKPLICDARGLGPLPA